MSGPVTTILGLGREVGATIARRFDEAGHQLMVADTDVERLDKTVADLSETTAKYHGDLHTKLGLRNCLAATLEAHGRVDNVLIVPPISAPDGLDEMEMERFDKSLAKTTRGAILALRIFSEQFATQDTVSATGLERIRQRGTFTFILSLSAKLPNLGCFTEAVTQNALIGVVRSGALELAASDIRCNAIAAVRPRAEADEPWLKMRTPLGRTAKSDEIASAALYLSSLQAAIITGEVLTLDGGRSVLSGVLDA